MAIIATVLCNFVQYNCFFRCHSGSALADRSSSNAEKFREEFKVPSKALILYGPAGIRLQEVWPSHLSSAVEKIRLNKNFTFCVQFGWACCP